MAKTAATKEAAKRSSGKRELLRAPGRRAQYAKRNAKGEFTEMDDVGRSQRADRRTKAKTMVKPGLWRSGRPARSNEEEVHSEAQFLTATISRTRTGRARRNGKGP